jgi:hypothetical protein
MVPEMLDLEVIKDAAKIMNKAIKDKVQLNLIIRAGGNAPLIAQEIAKRLHSEERQGVF